MRIFKTKVFARFARQERVVDARLVSAIDAAQRGLVDADLGGGLIKQRLARSGKGKRGGYRLLIAFRTENLAIFLFGFAKNERDNIDDLQMKTLREIASVWFGANATKIAQAVRDGVLIEVEHGDENKDDI